MIYRICIQDGQNGIKASERLLGMPKLSFIYKYDLLENYFFVNTAVRNSTNNQPQKSIAIPRTFCYK